MPCMDAKTRPLGWSLLVAGIITGSSTVRAQDLSSYFPQGVPGYDVPGPKVLARPRPLYDPIGVRAGDFLLYPHFDLGVGYDSNVLGGNPAQGSWLLGTHGSVLANSDWSRNSLGAYVGIDNRRALNLPSQSRTDWTGSFGGTLDVGRDRLTLAAAHLSLHQDRTSIDALPTDQPVAYQVNDFRTNFVHTFDRLSVTPSLEVFSYRFGSATILGVPTPQSDRDRNVLQSGVAASYEVAPERAVMVVVRGLGSIYTSPQPGAPSRNSDGVVALSGINYGSANWGLRLLGGWEQRNFQAPQYQSHGAAVAEMDANWSPSGLTTITGTLTRSIEDAAQEGVAGYTYTSARLEIDHEYLRNVLLHGGASVQRADFLQGGGAQTSYSLAAGVTWLMNCRMRISATEAFIDLRSTQGQPASLGGSYVRAVTLLTLGLGL